VQQGPRATKVTKASRACPVPADNEVCACFRLFPSPSYFKSTSIGAPGPMGPKGNNGPRGFDGIRGPIGPTVAPPARRCFCLLNNNWILLV
jgi:hypothetical protein